MTRIELFQEALAGCRALYAKYPDHSSYGSIIRQLDYLISLEEGRSKDWDGLKNVTVGLAAVREVEDVDAGLAAMLHQVSGEVRRMMSEHPRPRPDKRVWKAIDSGDTIFNS